jgi:hypothetical protein
MTNKQIILAFIVVGIVAIAGMFFPAQRQQLAGAIYSTSTPAVVNSTPNSVQVVLNMTGTYASSTNNYLVSGTSLTNNPVCNYSGYDRAVTSVDYYFNGIDHTVSTSTASAFALTVATSTYTGTYGTNTNYLVNATLATSAAEILASVATSTTAGVTSTIDYHLWANNTCLDVMSAATTTAYGVIKFGFLQL